MKFRFRSTASDGQSCVSGADLASEPLRLGLRGGARAYFARTFESLGVRNFRLLWLGMLITSGGFQMQGIAGGILVYELTDDAVLTSIAVMGWAPGLLGVSLFGGVLGDRLERRLLIQFSQAVQAISAGVLAILIWNDVVDWTHLFAASVIQGAMFALQVPARQAVVPALVGKERLSNAVALNAMAFSITTVVAPGIGGLIYAIGGPEVAYLTVLGMTSIGVLITGMLPKMYPSGKSSAGSVLASIKSGLIYFWNNRLVKLLLAYSLMLALLSLPFTMMVAVFAKDLYEVSPSGVGLLATMTGIVGVAAAMVSAGLRKGQYRGMVVLSAGVITGVGLLLIAIIPVYIVGLVVMMAIGFGQTIRWGLGQALIMEETADEYRARMMSLSLMTYGVMPVAVLPLGLAIKHFGAANSVFGMSVLLLITATIFIVFGSNLRNLR